MVWQIPSLVCWTVLDASLAPSLARIIELSSGINSTPKASNDVS